jgi:hypothetical protein
MESGASAISGFCPRSSSIFSISMNDWRISRYVKPRKFSGIYRLSRIWIAAVTSPGPIRPCAASFPAITASSVRPMLMMIAWMAFSSAIEVFDLTAALA